MNMGTPPVNPGVMTPDSKAALGARLGLDTPPAVTSGSGVVPSGDLSAADTPAMAGEMADAYGEDAAYQTEARDIILASPAGSTASEGYHLYQQSEAVRENEQPLPVGPFPVPRPQEERA